MRYLLALFLAATPPFSDATLESRISFQHAASKTSSKYLIEAMGGGVAMIDADGDGWLDLFFTNGAALRPGMTAQDLPDKSAPTYWNRLYRNLGDGTFRDITQQAGLRGSGYGQGVAVGDCDNDGKSDLYVTALGSNTLYRNQGNAIFLDVTTPSGTASAGWSTSAGFLDYDRDGQLDLFVARYLDWDFSKNKWCGGPGPLRAYCHPNEFKPITHRLYRGLGGCRFEDATQKAGITKSPGKGLGVAFADIDRDGWPDILVANDSYPQQFFRNRRDGTFEEIGLASGLAYDDDGKVFAGMGIAVADYDGDGWPDVFVNALANQGYALFRSLQGLFDYVSASTGMATVSKLHSGWGAGFLDYDGDGARDLFVAQGHVMDNIELTQPGILYKELPLLLHQENGKFQTVPPLAAPMAARGAAFGDLNNDGAIDIAVATNDGPPRILRNRPGPHHWLMVDTVGKKSNHDGLGAAIRLVSKSGREQFGYVSTAGSYLAANDKRVHFGLGEDDIVKILEIRWPSGRVQTWNDITVDRTFLAREP